MAPRPKDASQPNERWLHTARPVTKSMGVAGVPGSSVDRSVELERYVVPAVILDILVFVGESLPLIVRRVWQ